MANLLAHLTDQMVYAHIYFGVFFFLMKFLVFASVCLALSIFFFAYIDVSTNQNATLLFEKRNSYVYCCHLYKRYSHEIYITCSFAHMTNWCRRKKSGLFELIT